jgi:hypothetical protein
VFRGWVRRSDFAEYTEGKVPNFLPLPRYVAHKHEPEEFMIRNTSVTLVAVFLIAAGLAVGQDVSKAKPSGSNTNPAPGVVVVTPKGIIPASSPLEPPAALPISVTSPNGNERWKLGSKVKITWKLKQNPTDNSQSGSTPTYTISLSRDGGKTYARIASGLSIGTGDYTWRVRGPTARKCLIKIALLNADRPCEDTSDAFFQITGGPDMPHHDDVNQR